MKHSPRNVRRRAHTHPELSIENRSIDMELKEYFDKHNGFGVLSTADGEGRVNAAVFARPHFFDDGSVGFIMPDRLTHRNLTVNDYAAYLFREDTGEKEHAYLGKRLYLKKIEEVRDEARIAPLRRRTYGDDRDGSFLVIFKVEKILSLIGSGP